MTLVTESNLSLARSKSVEPDQTRVKIRPERPHKAPPQVRIAGARQFTADDEWPQPPVVEPTETDQPALQIVPEDTEGADADTGSDALPETNLSSNVGADEPDWPSTDDVEDSAAMTAFLSVGPDQSGVLFDEEDAPASERSSSILASEESHSVLSESTPLIDAEPRGGYLDGVGGGDTYRRSTIGGPSDPSTGRMKAAMLVLVGAAAVTVVGLTYLKAGGEEPFTVASATPELSDADSGVSEPAEGKDVSSFVNGPELDNNSDLEVASQVGDSPAPNSPESDALPVLGLGEPAPGELGSGTDVETPASSTTSTTEAPTTNADEAADPAEDTTKATEDESTTESGAVDTKTEETAEQEDNTDATTDSVDEATDETSTETLEEESTEEPVEGEEAVETNESDESQDSEEVTEVAVEEGFVDAGNGVAVPAVLLDIRFCESTDNYTAANAHSSARGAYQFLTGSWADHGHAKRFGVTRASLATPAEQDEAALITWEKYGTKPWAASQSCWSKNPVQ